MSNENAAVAKYVRDTFGDEGMTANELWALWNRYIQRSDVAPERIAFIKKCMDYLTVHYHVD